MSDKIDFANCQGEWYEEEWWSDCCTAPPLFDLHIEEGIEPLGLCMQCRDNATFSKGEEDDTKTESVEPLKTR